MFCGIKDFNQFCNKNSEDSNKIVDLLNTVFTKIDKKTQKYPEIYKVETVGDKYMAVCGLPLKVDSHTKSMCLLALDIIDTFKGIHNVDGNEIIVRLIIDFFVRIGLVSFFVQITIGINCGEVVTGVIGKRVPRYCLFGDTVNLTSRCETTGTKGKINITENAYELVLVFLFFFFFLNFNNFLKKFNETREF
jgi:guanylate cyclase soluble subunit beta